MSVNLKAIYAFARELYPKNVTENIKYGTAGFRSRADKLEYVMYRMGLLATLRSRAKGGQTIGVMITASHNPEPDNGCKLIDPMGEMLEEKWEQLATNLVNVSDTELQGEIEKIIKTEQITITSPSSIFVGMDNRYHSPGLLKAVSDGVLTLKGNVKSFGLCTTPMLHYFVVCANTNGAYGEASEKGYFTKLSNSFKNLRTHNKLQNPSHSYVNRLLFDGSNGVGARKMLQFLKMLDDNSLIVEVFNKGEGKINYMCGADYVKVQQKCPVGLPECKPYTRCVSVDGDADRIVYYFVDENNQFNLLDGDRIATLVAGYLKDLLAKCGIDLTLGLIQTAYANGASTDYIQHKLKVPVAFTATGVKHLHHKALEYDVGVYFEANGHGTVIFSNKARKTIHAASKNVDNIYNEDQVVAAKTLLLTIDLINETVGDAISDLLLVETILHANGWNVKEWLASYTDLPNVQKKIIVADRGIITVENTEKGNVTCLTPNELQKYIDQCVEKYSKGRSFVRASGTEDVVRVYAEASTKEDVEQLAYDVSLLVYEMAGGVGDKPLMSNCL